MKSVRLTRIASNHQHGTFGALTINGQPICLTLEPYTRDNERNISCIPTGQYICNRVDSPKYGDVFEVSNIQNRSHVLFHWGNRDKDTEGCILLGEEFGLLHGDWSVLSSKKAFNEFMNILKEEDQFTLTITESY